MIGDPGGPIRVIVKNRLEMDHQLDRAVEGLQVDALRSKDRGILVTRHSAHEFTVELHAGVPFGLTYERQDW